VKAAFRKKQWKIPSNVVFEQCEKDQYEKNKPQKDEGRSDQFSFARVSVGTIFDQCSMRMAMDALAERPFHRSIVCRVGSRAARERDAKHIELMKHYQSSYSIRSAATQSTTPGPSARPRRDARRVAHMGESGALSRHHRPQFMVFAIPKKCYQISIKKKPKGCAVKAVLKARKVPTILQIGVSHDFVKKYLHQDVIDKTSKGYISFTHHVNKLRFGPDFPGFIPVLDGLKRQHEHGFFFSGFFLY